MNKNNNKTLISFTSDKTYSPKELDDIIGFGLNIKRMPPVSPFKILKVEDDLYMNDAFKKWIESIEKYPKRSIILNGEKPSSLKELSEFRDLIVNKYPKDLKIVVNATVSTDLTIEIDNESITINKSTALSDYFHGINKKEVIYNIDLRIEEIKDMNNWALKELKRCVLDSFTNILPVSKDSFSIKFSDNCRFKFADYDFELTLKESDSTRAFNKVLIKYSKDGFESNTTIPVSTLKNRLDKTFRLILSE